MSYFRAKDNQKGQILLIVVLAGVIALTVGLSLVSRTVTNVKTTTEEANSQKALSAAEAGVEQLLKAGVPVGPGGGPVVSLNGDVATNSKFSATSTDVKGSTILVNGGNSIQQDDGVDIWLSTYSTNPAVVYTSPWSGNLLIHWGISQCPNKAAIEVVFISGSKASPTLTRYAYDPCSGIGRRDSNGFTNPSAGSYNIGGKIFTNRATIPVTNGLIARVVPLYTGSPIGIVGNSSLGTPLALPSQGYIIDSEGSSGETKRKIKVYQGYPKLPAEYFQYNVFSP